jgi:hypothetical protein
MTDTTTFLNFCVLTCQNFNRTLEDLKSISDRIAADSALSTNTAATAQKTSRTDLTAASFDNLKVCIDLVTTVLNSTNGSNVSVAVNTGGTVKLGFYQMI